MPVHSDNNNNKINEGVNPSEIKTLSDRELHINTEEPNNDIVNTMFKKIQTLTITYECQDTAVLH